MVTKSEAIAAFNEVYQPAREAIKAADIARDYATNDLDRMKAERIMFRCQENIEAAHKAFGRVWDPSWG